MDLNKDYLKPSYQKKYGLNVAFLLTCMFCGNFKDDIFDREFAYILHMANIIDFNALRSKYPNLNNDDLLREIFFISRNEKSFKLEDLRAITGLNSKDTFRDRFEGYLKALKLDKRRAFTLEETYKLLDFWNPEFKGDSMQAFLKKELADMYTSGDSDLLAELLIDNKVVSKEEYKSKDKFSPKVYNKLEELTNTEIYGSEKGHHSFCFYMFIVSRIKLLQHN